MKIRPQDKIIELIYTHLSMIRETVVCNGNLRAEFFRNIWMVEKVRKAFDEEEKQILQRVLTEGAEQGKFHLAHIGLMTDIIHYTVRGLEVPYIYDRLGEGLTEEETYPIVLDIVSKALGADESLTNEILSQTK